MGISEKLTYLNETKDLIKQAIVNKGVEVSDEDTFRSYANKISTIENTVGEKVTLQEKSVIPTTTQQEIVADEGYTGLSKVTVNAIETEELSITPTKDTQTQEGLYGKVIVLGDENLVANNIKQGITIFGVEGNMAGAWDTTQIRRCQNMFRDNKEMIDAPYFDTSNVETMSNMFEGCENLKTVPNYNLSKVTSTYYMFRSCTNLEVIGNFDTSNVTNMGSMFSNCRNEKLVIPLLNCEKVDSINSVLSMCYSLKNVMGFKNLGKGYTSKSNNYYNYQLDLSDCRNLTHDSLMNIINNLYDLNLTYDVANGGTLYTQQLVLGSTNLAKLTSEEIQLATSKGWSVS